MKTIIFLLFFHYSFLSFCQLIDPQIALKQAYEQSQVLLVATANHKNYKVYEQMSELIESIGDDEKLKYVVIERSFIDSSFYKSLSVDDLNTSIDKVFKDQDWKIKNTLCFPERAYTVGKFFPMIRQINQKRHKDKIVILPIDSMNDEQTEAIILYRNVKKNIDCQSTKNSYDFVSSFDREVQTSKNFLKVYKKLKKDEKMIVIYQQAHLLTDMLQCSLSRKSRSVESQYNPLSWFDLALEQKKGNISYKMVVFDEKDSTYNPNGSYSLTQQIRELNKTEQSFAIDLKKTVKDLSVIEKSGAAIFQEDSFISRYNDGVKSVKNKKLSEIADYLIWNEDAHLNYKLKKSRDYLPNICD